jgi:Uma2 family endonuclease
LYSSDPRVVVEVLSDGTEAYDRGQELEHHRRIPSLGAVVLVSHRAPIIEVWKRNSGDRWERREFGSGHLAEIEALAASLPVDEVYLGIQA